MATKARAGVGATLSMGNGASPEVFTAVAGIVNLSGPELSVEELEATSLDSTGGYKEYIPGMKDGGAVSFTMHFSNDAQQRSLRGKLGAATTANFRVTLPTSPVCTINFAANLTSWSQATEANAPMTADVNLKISGAPVFTP
jgi:predicted secreted protein